MLLPYFSDWWRQRLNSGHRRPVDPLEEMVYGLTLIQRLSFLLAVGRMISLRGLRPAPPSPPGTRQVMFGWHGRQRIWPVIRRL